MLDIVSRARRSAVLALVLSPVGLLIIAAARLLIISDYNTVTASTIVSTSGYVNTFLGTVIPMVPIFMPYVALILLFSRRFLVGALALLVSLLISPAIVGRENAIRFLEREGLAMLHWYTSNFWIIAGVGIVGALAIAFMLWEFVGFGAASFMRSTGVILSIFVLGCTLRVFPFPFTNSYYLDVIRQPWLPAESITFSNQANVVGYTLSTDGDWVEFLRSSDRKIIFIREPSITAQHICQLVPAATGQPLIALAHPDSRVQSCRTVPTGPPLLPSQTRVGGLR